jgi:hypothetical protein
MSQHPIGKPPHLPAALPEASADSALPALETLDAKTLAARLDADSPSSIDLLKQIMRSNPPSDPERKSRYLERLIDDTLETRDAESAQIAAAQMDADAHMDALLWKRLEAALTTHPDAVYAFARARLSVTPPPAPLPNAFPPPNAVPAAIPINGSVSATALDARWLARLRAAGLASLQVAISDGDADTVVNWLKLVAREPAAYGLSDLLHQGLLAARARAINEPPLARGVLTLAIKRDPEAARLFLNDTALLDALPNNLGMIFRSGTGDAAALLQAHGAEVFAAALTRAARAAQPDLFTPPVVEAIWALAAGTTTQSIPHYLPDHAPFDVIAEWKETGAIWLSDAALRMLLSLALRDHRDDLFLSVGGGLEGQDRQLVLLADGLIGADRGVSDAMSLIAQLTALEKLTPQAAVDLDVLLLTAWDWTRAALSVMAQIARTAQAHPTVTAALDVWWRLLEVAEDAREEPIARAALKRLTAELDDDAESDDGALTEALLRLHPLATWNATLRAAFMTWWRGFVRAQPQARLQRLDKLFDGKRTLEELRAVVETVIAFRKMIGKRPIKTFIADIETTFRVLTALSEAFDPTPRRPFAFDPAAIREELDANGSELSESELKILTHTLKELASALGTLGDNRSKASLMRRGEDVDRQLETGEQAPHSAVDALKWMSGYLSGAHDRADETDS